MLLGVDKWKDWVVDRLTESCKRINFAKICVEVDASFPLPEQFDLTLPSGAVFTIRVWYPWKPLKCNSCNVLGHKNCVVKTDPIGPKQQVWVVKPSISSVGAPFVAPAKDLPDSIEVPCMGFFSAKVGVCPTLLSSAKDKVVSADPCVSVVVGAESVTGSSSGTKDGANMFSVQQMEDGVSQKGVDSGDVLESLPTDEEFVAGLTHDVIVTSLVPKTRGRERSKGVKKPVNNS
ncbi:hypothetical protein RHMOL_Rhmol05G0146700 [Rhododendron molle]|uniref:Uncharacterized protein n=1 Tax=Rhododendron molle TaxID=49168 RepID=A0ACC0NQC1_RHOML|nr:hypothetical protein RHMOL_Rhmol05G0146700 [Rhododendron molle]